jgi:microcystin-dependent protein
MTTHYLGQITCFGCNFPPTGWALCQGQILPISSNAALFSLLGTQFGGNGTSNFALPNLSGMVPIGQGQGAGLSPRVMGEMDGESTVTLISSTVPPHNHAFMAANVPATALSPTANQTLAQGNIPGSGKGGGQSTPINNFAAAGPAAQLNAAALTPFSGGNQPHNNMQPTLSMNWCIALTGVFPPRQ